jgi:molybdenum cofactor guanylyltransferase
LTNDIKITGIVIAGGRGTRFGKNKALIEIDHRKLIELVILNLKTVVDDVVIVTSAGQYEYIAGTGINEKIVLDIVPGKAAMGGVYTGLVNSNNFYSLVVACDMPLLNSGLLEYMKSLAPGNDAVIPMIGDYVEPLHAIYSKDCIPELKIMVENSALSLHLLRQRIKVRYVRRDEIERFDPDRLSMFNINTIADLNKVQNILAAKKND